MDAFRIIGGNRLEGEIIIGGAKNSALKLMAASLLADGDMELSNIPDIADVRLMCKLLESLGPTVEKTGPNAMTIGGKVESHTASYDIVSKMRASILVLGPLLARFGEASVSLPGGCAIGTRPVDLHLYGLERLGAEIVLDKGYIHAKRKGRLQGNKIPLSFPSVGATENIMMAATLAEGETSIINAAQEPEINDLASFLNKMGAKITGAGTSTIKIVGVPSLKGCAYSVMPDRLEAGTYAIAAMMTQGDLLLKHAGDEGQAPIFPKLSQVGCEITEEANGIRFKGKSKLVGGLDIKTEPYPGFPTDMQAQFMALLSVSEGASVITETVFENRFMHVAELRRMGANINLKGNTAMIKGVSELSGAKVMATDLRASFSLILAALFAQGETEISRIYHLDRGYESVESKLTAVGAKIERFRQG